MNEDKRTADFKIRDIITDVYGNIKRYLQNHPKAGQPIRRKYRAHVVDFKASNIHGFIDYSKNNQQENTNMTTDDILNELAIAAILKKNDKQLKDDLSKIKYAIDKRNEIDRQAFLAGTGLEDYGDEKIPSKTPEHHKIGSSMSNGDHNYVRVQKALKISEDDSLLDKISCGNGIPGLDRDHQELRSLASIVSSLYDIIHLYIPDEFAIIDADTGSHVSDILDPDKYLHEVLSHEERIKAALRFAAMHNMLQRRLMIALKQYSSPSVLKRRARHMAINIIKQKLAGGQPYDTLPIEEKERVDRVLETMHSQVDNLAMMLLPKIREIEINRLSHHAFTKSPQSE